VVLYDGVLKGGPVGFLTMGLTRGMNVLLGTTATTVSVASLPAWIYGIPLTVAAYVSGVTYMAAREATDPTRRSVLVAGVGMVTAGVAVVLLLASMGFDTSLFATVVGIVLAGGFVLITGRALGQAYRDPSPETVGPVIGTCVLALVVFDGAAAATAGVRWSLAAIVFLVPAAGLSQVFDVS
jgi:4-hydroxybenzoate polyprenyltransferase